MATGAPFRILQGDARAVLATLPAESVHCCVTSPPYWGLRDYGADGQIGLEPTPDAYVARLVAVFREVRRVLRDDGTLWLNLGDSYAGGGRGGGAFDSKQRTNVGSLAAVPHLTPTGLKPKDLVGVPWMVAFALRADGWYLRSDIIWAKPNPMPESVTDRPTKAHEYLFLLSKSERYYYDGEAIKEEATMKPQRRGVIGGKGNPDRAVGDNGKPQSRTEREAPDVDGDGSRNRRTVWTVATQPFSGAVLGSDYVGADGKPYKRSPDCPVHGRLRGSGTPQTGADDEPRDPTEMSSQGSAIHPAPTLPAGDASIPDHDSPRSPMPTEQPRTLQSNADHRSDDPAGAAAPQSHPDTERTSETSACSSDSRDPSRAQTAMPHSSESRRTDHDPVTTPACTASAQSPENTGRSAGSLSLFGSAEHSRGNSREQDATGDRPSAQTPSSSGRRSSPRKGKAAKCTCQLVTVDHFATFPPALVEPCIKAGTSEHGVCAECGEPWVRVIETRRNGSSLANPEKLNRLATEVAITGGTSGRRLGPNVADEKSTVGWRPTCAHDATPVPAMVLDPFSGAGTTGLVATRLQRSYVGIELNPDYVAMSERRIRGDAPLFHGVA